MTEELLSEWPKAQNWIFVIFLFCFLINVHVLGARRKMITTLFYSLFRPNEKDSLFTEPVDNEFVSKILLSFQTILLFAIILYCVLIHESLVTFDWVRNMLILVGGAAGILLLFGLIKFLLNYLFGNIFFEREKVRLWNETLFSMLSLSSLFLFIPALIMFYIPAAYFFCYYFVLLYLLFFIFLTIYKIYEIFFLRKRLLLYFIL
ncbi:MAG: DUF4271 domain-containing protein, partial [Bacteroidales bacterium]|nr:DUF4271 domain-containing protein [Bacteroidales bacterium]